MLKIVSIKFPKREFLFFPEKGIFPQNRSDVEYQMLHKAEHIRQGKKGQRGYL